MQNVELLVYYTGSHLFRCPSNQTAIETNGISLTEWTMMVRRIGGSTYKTLRCTPLPYGTQFFHYHIHFHQKGPMSAVHALPHKTGPCSPLREILDPPLRRTDPKTVRDC